MAQVVQAVKAAVMDSAKIRDLSRDIQDQESLKGSGMTTDHGTAILDTDNWLKVNNGETVGPSLLEDQIAREKIMRFDHERIPERVVHARGTGAHGYFKLHTAIPEYSFAGVLNDTSRKTPVFVRFSTFQGPRGSADTVRDVRGFAIKFYTEEGNWDLVGNDLAPFVIQDAMKSAHPNFYDYVSLQPETLHMLMWLMSDRGIPRSYRMMQGFGVNTFKLVNKSNEAFFVKFHLDPELGVHSLTWDEAQKIAGQDPDFHRRDLEDAIKSGAYPRWTFAIQVLPMDREHEFDFDILDSTKIWPEELVPKIPIGELVLDTVVDEFFTETEQVAFCTSHIVPGIAFSDDPVLQGRNFSYFDTQITRLGGPNWQEIPINRPVCPVMNFNRDGFMRHKITKSSVNYWPNRLEAVPPQAEKFKAQGLPLDHPQPVNGIKQRLRAPKFLEHYNQATMFYNSLVPYEQAHLIGALSFELNKVGEEIVIERMIEALNQIDHNLATKVAINVGGPVPAKPARPNHGKVSKGLSQEDFKPVKVTIKSRKIAILIADGFDLAGYEAIKAAILSGSALVKTFCPTKTGAKSGSGKIVKGDFHFEGDRSTIYDAVMIPGGEHAKILACNGRAVHWIREAFGHCKAIGAFGEAVDLVKAALPLPELKFAEDVDSDTVVCSYGVVTARKESLTAAVAEMAPIAMGQKGFVNNFAFQVAQHRCWAREMDGLTQRVAF